MTTTIGALPRPVTLESGVRPIVLVVPAGIDSKERDFGYAVERDGGIFRREEAPADLVDGKSPDVLPDKMFWRSLELPMSSPINIQAMVAAPLGENRFGALVFVTESSKEGVVGVAWLHDPSRNWIRAELPEGTVVKAAVRTPKGVWISTLEGKLMPVSTGGGRIAFGRAVQSQTFCDLLSLRQDESLACVSRPLLGGRTNASVKKERPIARGTIIPLSILEPGADIEQKVTRWRFEAPNPLGQPFAEPITATFNHIKDVGEHVWISTGVGVYSRPVALDGVLPAKVEEGSRSVVNCVPPMILSLALIVSGFLLLSWLRRRRTSKAPAGKGVASVKKKRSVPTTVDHKKKDLEVAKTVTAVREAEVSKPDSVDGSSSAQTREEDPPEGP